MKKIAFGVIAAAVLALGAGGTAAAGPTCSEALDIKNHGEHILRDYVRTDSGAAGGAPAHRGSGVQPGASFCISQAQSKPLPLLP